MSSERGRDYLEEIAENMGLPITERDIDRYSDHHPDSANVKPIQEFEQRVIDHILMPESEKGMLMPWTKTHSYFRFRAGELTVWTGVRGHGKSAFLNMVLLGLAQQGKKSCICSFEMKAEDTIPRLCSQWTGIEESKLPIPEIKNFFQAHTDKLYIYDQVGSVNTQRVLALAKFCAIDLQLDHLVIDSLMKCRIGSDDYSKSELFVNDLQNIAKDYGIHIHLVAHQTKDMESGSENSIRGSGMIPDIADNIWEIKKDTEKFEKEADGLLDYLDNKKYQDFTAKLLKQRHSTIIVPRKFGFWAHNSMQFLPRFGMPPMTSDDWRESRWM